jgi:hypothetical protein
MKFYILTQEGFPSVSLFTLMRSNFEKERDIGRVMAVFSYLKPNQDVKQ